MINWEEEEKSRTEQERANFLAQGYSPRLADMGVRWAIAETRKKISPEHGPKGYVLELDHNLHEGAHKLIRNYLKAMTQQ